MPPLRFLLGLRNSQSPLLPIVSLVFKTQEVKNITFTTDTTIDAVHDSARTADTLMVIDNLLDTIRTLWSDRP